MSIRIKFFLVLLVFSLIPLLTITISSRHSINRLGDDLAGDVRAHLTEAISRDLTKSAQVSANAISNEVANLQLSLHYLAGTVTQILDSSDGLLQGRVYTPESFKNPSTAPPDLAMSWRYTRVTDGGVLMPSAVSTGHPVVVLPPNRHRALWPQARRLQNLTPVFRDIYNLNNGLAYRVYVGFENGLHVSFPGHGNYAPGFDPRQRPWFVDTLKRGNLTWLSHTDSTTQNVVFTVGVPIHDRENQVIGVGAIDFLPNEFMKMDQLKAQWSQDTLAFLVSPVIHASDKTQGLQIIAAGTPLEKDQTDAAETAAHYLAIDDDARQLAFIAAMQAADNGHMDMPYKGIPSIWAYARFEPPMDDALRIVLVVPQTVIESLSEQVGNNVLDQTYYIYRVTGITAVLLLVLVLLVGWIGSRTILRPLYAMLDAWERLSTGDFSVRINYRTGDERDTMIDAFNTIVPRLEAHWNLSQSMELARQIQQNLLPDQTLELPGLDLAGDSHYCDATGGDYYDVFKTGSPGEKRFAVAVGDISGHGVGSALLMTTARAMIRSISILEEDTARRITLMNRLLYPDTTDTGDFLTLFYLEFDMAQRQLHWVRAGHDPAILYNPADDRFSELNGDGMALGIEEDYHFKAYTMPLGRPGQVIVIGTDGIWEAHNPEREMFGKDRLRAVIRNHHHLNAHAMKDRVFKAVADFTGTDQDDDITLAVIKVL
jgi:sigma-B regulation protein RsbU (phosphoserine phosphatase)